MNADDFKAALGRFASGVTIITCKDQAGRPTGLTATSFASVSLNPPLVLFCLAKSTNCFDAFQATGAFGVNILARDQEQLSNRFASKEEDKFRGAAVYDGSLGSPLLEGALVRMDCAVEARYPGGDHIIYVGLVKSVELAESAPLLYFQGKYHSV
jgi:3-hydroxy-9,10-secoandrosta-1,3,5(10)-triene-9,17-dione monooxygenase reductase component